MKYLKSIVITAILVIFLSSCYSVTPKVDRSREVGEGTYTVRISGDFTEIETKYAINSFVKSKGYDSYDIELTRSFPWYKEYTVTMPGSTPVEDLPKVRKWRQINPGTLL
jgi:hypothetical protein